MSLNKTQPRSTRWKPNCDRQIASKSRYIPPGHANMCAINDLVSDGVFSEKYRLRSMYYCHLISAPKLQTAIGPVNS